MSEFIVVAFSDEASARQGLKVLTDLKSDRLKVHGAGIVTKDDKGKLSMEVVSDEGIRLVAVGALLGGLAGLSIGLLATAILAAGGAVSGIAAALTHRGAGEQIMKNVARQLQAATAALVADVETDDLAGLKSRLEALGGIVQQHN